MLYLRPSPTAKSRPTHGANTSNGHVSVQRLVCLRRVTCIELAEGGSTLRLQYGSPDHVLDIDFSDDPSSAKRAFNEILKSSRARGELIDVGG